MSKELGTKTTSKGTELPLLNLKGKPYLQVAHRLVWFREDHPNATINTEVIKAGDNFAVVKASILLYDAKHNLFQPVAQAHKFESAENFPDYIEKAETGAVGRALAMAGYGTQFEPELDEGIRLADAPIPIPAKSQRLEEVSQLASGLLEEVKKLTYVVEAKKKMSRADIKAKLKKEYGVDFAKDLAENDLSKFYNELQALVA